MLVDFHHGVFDTKEFSHLLAGITLLGLLGTFFLLALALLEQSLGDQNLVVSSDSPEIAGQSIRSMPRRLRMTLGEELRHRVRLALMHSSLRALGALSKSELRISLRST